MNCPVCGTPMSEATKFCTNCGTQLQPTAPQYTPPVIDNTQFDPVPVRPAPQKVTFLSAIVTFFRKYAVFSGRATRSEYWYVYLAGVIVGFIFLLVDFLLPGIGTILNVLCYLVSVIPGIALFVRRLHDIGKSAWNLLWLLFPIVGHFIFFIFTLRASDADNKYGPAYM